MKYINDFSVHMQCYKNNFAVEYCISQFRKYYPDNKFRIISDNGDDFTELSKKYNLLYSHGDKNILPNGKMNCSDDVYEYLYRIYNTCKLFDSEWILLMEEDVLTKNYIKSFPMTDSAGIALHPLSFELTNYIRNFNSTSKIGYGMCGGSIFKRESFISAYNNIDKFDMDLLSKMDNRIMHWTDIPLTVLFLLNGYSYSIWNEIEQPDAGVIIENASFEHNFKKFY